jgi:ribosomal protein S18 acetylase RimI-like enzyme
MRIEEVTVFNEDVFNAVLRLLPQLDPKANLPSEEHFRNILQSEQTHFFTVKLENDFVGILTLALYDIPTGKKVWIEDVVVDVNHRGKGLGKELLLFAIEFAGTIGAKSIELTSRPSRLEANTLYKKLGFILRETNMYKYIIS